MMTRYNHEDNVAALYQTKEELGALRNDLILSPGFCWISEGGIAGIPG